MARDVYMNALTGKFVKFYRTRWLILTVSVSPVVPKPKVLKIQTLFKRRKGDEQNMTKSNINPGQGIRGLRSKKNK